MRFHARTFAILAAFFVALPSAHLALADPGKNRPTATVAPSPSPSPTPTATPAPTSPVPTPTPATGTPGSPATPSPNILPGGGSQVVGPYASYTSASTVSKAINEGWLDIADVAGTGTSSSPYTASTGEDSNVVYSCVHNGCGFTWLSFWTVSGPAAGSGDTWYSAGNKAGHAAANSLKTASNGSGRYPDFIVLDPEGYVQPTSNSQYSNFIQGFADGINQTNLGASYTVGFYDNQSDYNTYSLGSISHPAFIAVSPILSNSPYVSGSNIEGYITYYAYCDASDGSASRYVNQVESWPASTANTVQFSDSGVDCGPY